MSLYLVCNDIFRFSIESLRGYDREQLIDAIHPPQSRYILMILADIAL